MESKAYKLGTHRTRLPADTIRIVQPFLKKMGITRVANVTGLDRVGIPVYTAFRPNSKSISVSQGKGSEREAAKVSAIMESIEAYHAENIDHPIHFGSVNQLQEKLCLVDVSQMPRSGDAVDADESLFWIEATNYLNQERCWIPYEVVSADYTLPTLRGYGHFPANTNGLASGNTQLEAIGHAIYEVVERDAESIWRQQGANEQRATGLDLNSIDDPNCQWLLTQFEAANIEIKIWEITTDINIPCYICLAIGDEQDWADPEFGSGCHTSKEVALARALTEAAQARATFIAGSRDDIGQSEYQTQNRNKRSQLGLAQTKRHEPIIRFDQSHSFNGEDMQQDLDYCLNQLTQVGLDQVYVVDLSQAEFGIDVVKVVIPGLEGAFGHWHSGYVPGARAQAVIKHPFDVGLS